MSRKFDFMRAARAWQAKNPGSEVWICNNGSGQATIRVNGRTCTPEAFFAEIGGKFTERKEIPLRFGAGATKEWNCGPIALAAITGKTPEEISTYIATAYKRKGGIDLEDAKCVLSALGFGYQHIGKGWPLYGLAVVEFGKTHMICASEKAGRRFVLDNATLAKGWIAVEDWVKLVIRDREWCVREAIEVA